MDGLVRRGGFCQALDSVGSPNHQHEFLDPYFVEGHHVTVHTVAYVPGKCLAVVGAFYGLNTL